MIVNIATFKDLIIKLGGTGSNRELGRAPVKEAIKILVILAPRGTRTASLMGMYCSPLLEFARSNTSDKNVNMELEASLWVGEKVRQMLVPYIIWRGVRERKERATIPMLYSDPNHSTIY